MLLGTAKLLHNNYELGDIVEILFPVGDDTITYSVTAFALSHQKYIGPTGSLEDTETLIPMALVYNPLDSTRMYAKAEISTYFLTQPDILFIRASNDADATNQVFTEVQVGVRVAYATDMITLYGFLYDTQGNPLANKVVTFSVLNSATYFDNSPVTRLNAYTITDNNGKFTITLNRNYDYVLSLNEFNYTKVIKVSEIPDNVQEIEVVIGRGLVCN